MAPKKVAERQGFEPWVLKEHNGFRDRPVRPLRHLSEQNIQQNALNVTFTVDQVEPINLFYLDPPILKL